MLFEVIRNNKVIMYTEDDVCIPDTSEIEQLYDAGYKIRYNRKIYNTLDALLRAQECNMGVADTDTLVTSNYLEPVNITSRTIYCLETEKVYKTQAVAATELNLDPASLSYAIKCKIPYKGYTFVKYLDYIASQKVGG